MYIFRGSGFFCVWSIYMTASPQPSPNIGKFERRTGVIDPIQSFTTAKRRHSINESRNKKAVFWPPCSQAK